jgi:putative FmdB family regulatory protein
MPIYEYACKACNSKFEKLVRSMTSEEKVACPSCGSKKTVRELSVFAVSAESAKTNNTSPGCGRCGGPGPCQMD